MPQQPMQPQMMPPQNMIGCVQGYVFDPMMMQKFQSLDKDHSGTVTVKEIKSAYSKFKFGDDEARMVLHATCDQPYLTMQTFPQFDMYITSMWMAFSQIGGGQPRLQVQQMHIAMKMLNFKYDQVVAQTLFDQYKEGQRGIDFGDFVAICSFFLICLKLEKQYTGKTVDYDNIQKIALWFM